MAAIDKTEHAIHINGVYKSFKLPHEQSSGIKQLLVNRLKGKKGYETQRVLQDISFDVKKGEFFGIVGRNGSGKSTLLKLLANIYQPDEGSIVINGKLTPFIELGVGFNPELTGRENVYMNGALLGFDRDQMSAMYSDIVAFAELENFMDQKLKNYSSGMQVRLAFSIAIRADTDILLIDEVLAVGDALFQQKCFDTFKEIKKRGKTVIFISHDLGSVEAFCDRVAVISKGVLVGVGQTSKMIMKYRKILIEYEDELRKDNEHIHVLGTGDATIHSASILNDLGKPTIEIKSGSSFTVNLAITAKQKLHNPVIGLGIINRDGVSVFGPNTSEADIITGDIHGDYQIKIYCKDTNLSPGVYSIRAAIFDDKGVIPYDFVENLTQFSITGKDRHGVIYLTPQWLIEQKT